MVSGQPLRRFALAAGGWALAAMLLACHHASPAVDPISPVLAQPAPPASPVVPAGPAPPAVPAPPAHPAPPALIALQHDLDAILAAPSLEHGYWGVIVTSLDTDDTLYALNARRLMMPASNMKIVTLAAAAARLGFDYQYSTTLMTSGAIAAGALHGDLVVVGSGDPSLTDATAPTVFAAWADALKTQGVTTIMGRIVGDDHALEGEPLGMGWSWDDLADGYAAGVGALQFNENMAHVTIAPGVAIGAPAVVVVAPDVAGLVLRNRVITGAADSVESLQAHRQPGSAELGLRGSIAMGSAPRVHTVSVDRPTQFFVAALRQALIANGIDVRGAAVDIDDVNDVPALDSRRLLVESRSPPLSRLAIRMMKASQNQYAETLLRTLGAAAGTPTAENGAATAALIVKGWDLPADELIQRDGSGLSRYDYVSPATLAAILIHVDRDEAMRTPFEASLPVAGKDGTLANRMKGTAADGNARAKSGSMANVRALSGYVATADGERLVFSVLANNFDAPSAIVNAATDAIVVRLAQYRR